MSPYYISDISKNIKKNKTAILFAVFLIQLAGFVYYVNFFQGHGYLPSPFIYDKSNTFMDWFNVLYWAYEDGRYTDWASVYPPLSFIILRFVNFVFAGGGYGDPEQMRASSQLVIAGIYLVYLIVPALVLNTSLWKGFSVIEKFLIYFVIILSAPMLFTLERGNLIMLSPILLALAMSKIGMARSLCIALLINIKPYFALLIIYYITRQNWKGFVVCSIFSGLVFAITGLALDNNFLVFFTNLFSFSQGVGIFSLREVMTFPSSISAFSYVLNAPDGAMFASGFLNPTIIPIMVSLIEYIKWSILAFSLATLFVKSRLMRDVEIFALLVVVISNLGVWVGGYTLILYFVLIPVFIKMRARWLYVALLSLIVIPLDVIPLLARSIGIQFSYMADAYLNIQWTLGLSSVVRPIVNVILLLLMSSEFLVRKNDSVKHKMVVHSELCEN